MNDALGQLLLILVFPGLLFSAVLGLLLSWVDRKVSARLQWRVGPRPSQPFWDVLKLLGKETSVPAEGHASAFLVAPLVSLSAAGLAAAAIWSAALGLGAAPFGDLIVVVYLLAIPPLMLMVGASASGNPLSAVGASREMKLVLAYELPFAAALLVAVFQLRPGGGGEECAPTLLLSGLVELQDRAGAVIGRPSGILAFVTALLCCQAKLGLVPFDVAEAECEIGEGVALEYGGGPLAILKLTQAVLLATLPALLVMVFWGGPAPTPAGIAAFAGEYLLVVVVFVLVKNTNPRARVDQALRFFWGPALALALLALVLAVEGV